MRTICRTGAVLGLIAFGYVLGSLGVVGPSPASAQQSADPLTDQHKEKIKAAYDALSSAMVVLEQDQLYKPAIKGMNAFAVSTGGLDAVRDLETTQAVDPETFVGLYAGEATDEVAKELTFDDEGRLLYKNKVVRMYPISKLRQLFARRRQLAGVEDTAAGLISRP